MKKFLSILLVLVLAFSLVACNDTAKTPDANDTPNADNNDISSDVDTSWTDVQSKGYLILGLDEEFPPMGYIDETTGEIVGFDIDLAKEVCSRLGIELKLQPIEWSSKDAELNNGNIDCIWNGLTKTAEREKAYTISDSYMNNSQVILVKANAKFNSLADLAGKTLGVQADSSALVALDENPEFKASLGNIIEVDSYANALLELDNGTIDCIAMDEIVARFNISKNPDAYRLIMDGNDAASLASEEYMIGFRKADVALKDKINETLKAMAADGKLAEISNKWFNEDVTIIK